MVAQLTREYVRRTAVIITPIVSLTISSGCGFRSQQGTGQQELAFLTEHFGVTWPTNFVEQHGGTLSMPAMAGGRPAEIAVKLVVTGPTFLSWRNSIKDRLKERQTQGGIADAKLSQHFSWWDARLISVSPVTQYSYERDPTKVGDGFLDVFVLETNGNRIMYIQGAGFR